MRNHRLFLLIPSILAAVTSAPGQLSWKQITTKVRPATINQGGLATDTKRKRVVLFGGLIRPGVFSNETWEWNGAVWKKLSPTGSPTARFQCEMVYDEARDRMVLFGGTGGLSSFFNNETFEFDGTNWKKMAPKTLPPKRLFGRMAYDKLRKRTVLFGGSDSSFNDLNDTWEWDGTNWVLIKTTRAPAARGSVSIAYDPAAKNIVLYGGSARSRFDDTWIYDGKNWTQKTVKVRPDARWDGAMAFDEVRGRMVLAGSGAGPERDTWEWDGRQWLKRIPTHVLEKDGPKCTFDPVRKRMLYYGGSGKTYELVSAKPSRVASYGSGCRGSNGVPAVSAAPYSMPLVGGRFDLNLRNLPKATSPVWLSIGVAKQNFDLSGIGMPGCFRLQSEDVVLAVSNGSGSASVAFPLPNNTALLGATAFVQAIAADSAANAFGATTSNGLEVKVGM